MYKQCEGLDGQTSLGSFDKMDENDSIVEAISFYTLALNVIAAWFNIKFVTSMATVSLTFPPKCTVLCPNLLLLFNTLIFNLFLLSMLNS